jgi:hypothetical protein
MKAFDLTVRCVDVPSHQVHKLEALYDRDRPIQFRTFARHVYWQQLARQMGYVIGASCGLRLSRDYHVRFYRSRWEGKPCYHMVHSAIDFVFTETTGSHPHAGHEPDAQYEPGTRHDPWG